MGNTRVNKKRDHDKEPIFNNQADYKVFVTNNFRIFHILDGNREVGRIGFIKKLIQKFGYMRMPILVNEKMEVIEGQHRLEACKDLNVPIHYIIQPGLGKEHCIALNIGRKNWSGRDYLHSNASTNYDYSLFEILTKKYPYSAGTILCTYDGSLTGGNYNTKVKNGSLKCSDDDFRMADKILNWLSGFDGDIKNAERRCKAEDKTFNGKDNIYKALIYAYKCPSLNTSLLTQRIHLHFDFFGDGVSGMTQAVSIIEKAYNYGCKNENKVDIYSDYIKEVKQRTWGRKK